MDKKVLTLIICCLLVTALTGSSSPGPGPIPLDAAEQAGLVGAGCAEAAGIMTTMAFASGLLFAPLPPASLFMLAVAGATGAGIAIWC